MSQHEFRCNYSVRISARLKPHCGGELLKRAGARPGTGLETIDNRFGIRTFALFRQRILNRFPRQSWQKYRSRFDAQRTLTPRKHVENEMTGVHFRGQIVFHRVDKRRRTQPTREIHRRAFVRRKRRMSSPSARRQAQNSVIKQSRGIGVGNQNNLFRRVFPNRHRAGKKLLKLFWTNNNFLAVDSGFPFYLSANPVFKNGIGNRAAVSQRCNRIHVNRR